MPSGRLSDDGRQAFAHGPGNVEWIGGRLFDDTQRHRRRPVEAYPTAYIGRPQLRRADVAQTDEVALGVAQDHVLELLGGAQVGLGEDGKLPLLALDAPGRDLHVLPAQRVLDLLWGHVEGGEPGRVEPQPHGVAALAEDTHLGHAGHGLQAVLDVAVGVIGDFERRMPVAEEGEVDDRLRVRLDLLDDRILGVIGEPSAHPADPVAHVRRGAVGIPVEPEGYGDLALFLPADRRHVVDAFDPGERVLEDVRDLAFDDVGAGADIGRLNGDDDRVDVGILTHRQPLIADKADQHYEQAENSGEDRAANADLGKLHRP